MNPEVSTVLSFGLTLVVFSYLLRDNFLYRLALAVFVGLAAAFTTIVTVENVILPLLAPLSELTDEALVGYLVFVLGVPMVLMLLLVLKPVTALKSVTNIAMAFLIAVGTAVALVGALTGTLIPITERTVTTDTTDVMGILNGVIGVVGVVTSLLYFQYMARRNPDGTVERPRVMKQIAAVGKGFIVVTLGAIYGAAILTSLSVLTGQLMILLG